MKNEISPMDRVHRHYIALRHADHRRRAAEDITLVARVWSDVLWQLGPFRRGLNVLIRNRASHPRDLKHLIQVLWFARKYRVDPECYFQYRLHEVWDRRNEYMFHDEIVAILSDLSARANGSDARDLEDKRRFEQRCSTAGLPTIPIVCDFQKGKVISDLTDRVAPDRDLFSKYANRYCGEGATLWQYSEGRYISGGLALTLDDLKRHLASLSSRYPVILQPRITNASELVALSGKALSTARVITIRHQNGAPEVALASYRMATGEHVADNFAVGGIACAISLDNGVLSAGTFKSSADREQRVRIHPDSGALIEGRSLPHWPAVKDLAVAAHSAFLSMSSVGWDIAITDDGPMLLEGNAVWCVDLAQMSHGCPLGDTPIAACLAEHLTE